MVDLSRKTDDEIDTWIANHERNGETQTELYRRLIEERNSRHGHGLAITVSVNAIVDAAKQGRFISYGEIAEANQVPWTKARHRMNGKHGHLDDLLAHCHANGLPLLTAIVVQKGKLNSGEMDDFTLDGFIEGVRRLGIAVTEPRDFLETCQRDCFVWAQQGSNATSDETREK